LVVEAGRVDEPVKAKPSISKPVLRLLILILDEGTNAVDQGTENELSNKFQTLSKSITIIVISHRPNRLAFCDDAVVLERENVAEQGSDFIQGCASRHAGWRHAAGIERGECSSGAKYFVDLVAKLGC
jgi:energy-coupling factor transporter ATP-binding protein EcfA2